MKVLIVGNGAREHAITKALAKSDVEIVAAMSRRNPGIASLSREVEIIDINNTELYKRFKGIDIAFIGPEAPLAAGVTNALNDLEIPVVGPTKDAAKLEWSKAFTRTFLNEQGIVGNPDFSICRTINEVEEFLKDHPDLAVKPDVLTGGKGVKITGEHLHNAQDVINYSKERIAEDGLIILEEKLYGNEFTLQAFTDGNRVEVMPLVRDYKRAYDDDTGPNTGSMGSYSSPNHDLPRISKDSVKKGTRIMEDTVRKLRKSGNTFKGTLYGGFMETKEDVYLIEYNCRFGDPEAMNVLSLLEDPLLDLGWTIIDGKLGKPTFQKKATVCVYLVPNGYPINPQRDRNIIINTTENSELYFASVHEEAGSIKTTGSRSIALLSKGNSIEDAADNVYKDVPKIQGDLFYRTDIGRLI